LQILYSIRSERMLVEQLRYSVLFRWFVGMSGTYTTWDPTTYTKNRDRFLGGEVAVVFFDKVLEKAEEAGLTSDERFSVDGTLIEAWASHKSFKLKKSDEQDPPIGNSGQDFRGEKRSNATHQSTTDADARLYKKSKGDAARMCLMGHVLSENRTGLVVNARATGKSERHAAIDMVAELGGEKRLTHGADKGYNTREFVAHLRMLKVTPHVAQNNKGLQERGRWPNHPARELRARPTQVRPGRGVFRLDEDGGRAAQDRTQGRQTDRLDVHLQRGGLLPRQAQNDKQATFPGRASIGPSAAASLQDEGVKL
jgi:hypothetical protein